MSQVFIKAKEPARMNEFNVSALGCEPDGGRDSLEGTAY